MAGRFLRTLTRAVAGLGERFWAQWDEVRHTAAVMGTVLYVCVQPRTWIHTVRRAFVQQMVVIGVEAIGLVCTIAILVGITVVVQLAFWIAEAGQSEMLGPLLVAVVARELGPVLIGLVVIIRSGSVMATELGILQIGGHVLALEAKGISPFLYLVVPRVMASAVSTFCLTIVFVLAALAAGYVFGAMAGRGSRDLPLLVNAVLGAVGPKDVLAILSKSLLPGLHTGASCCIGGLGVSGSLTEVPQAMQHALVRSIVGLLAISAVVSLLTYIGR
jgi:phospholipid/cholesterol/gamma-HCH transport system permease protein